MVYLGSDVWTSTYGDKTYINKRCYFASYCDSSEGGNGFKQTVIAIPTKNIIIDNLEPFTDYMCEFVPQETKDSNGNKITRMILADIAVKS